MDAVLACLEEIALEGLDGCPILHLWHLLEQRKACFPLKLDDAAKEFLWKGIVESLDVKFYVLEKPLPHIFPDADGNTLSLLTPEQRVLCQNDLNLDFSANTYCLINDETNGIRGSCPEYKTRQDVTADVRSQNQQCICSLKAAYQRWGDKLIIVASQAERCKVLLDREMDTNLFIGDIAYCFLEHVGKSRYSGRLQSSIAVHLSIDSKTCFYHMKKMLLAGAITKQNLLTAPRQGQMSISNVIRLKKYESRVTHKYEQMGEELSSLLAEQPDKKMKVTELRKHFGDNPNRWKTFKKGRRLLERLGFLKLIEDPNLIKKEKIKEKRNKRVSSEKGERGGDGHSSPPKLTDFAHLQLVKPYYIFDPVDASNDDEDEEALPNIGHPLYVCERSIVKQMYDCIEQHGADGASLKDIHAKLAPIRIDRNMGLRKLEKYGLIKGILIYAGKMNVKRYVAKPHVENSILSSRILKEEKKFQAIKDSTALQQTTTDASSLSQDSPCPSPAPSTHSTETNISEDMPDKPGTITYRILKRRNFILEFMQKHKVAEGITPFVKGIHDSEAKEGVPQKPDRKYVKRVVNELVREGLIKHFTTVINSDNIFKQIEFYIDASVSEHEPVVKEAVQNCRIKIMSMAREGVETRFKGKGERKKPGPKPRTAPPDDNEPRHISDPSLRFKFGYLAKFPRMRLFHEFLWFVTYEAKAPQRKSVLHSGQANGEATSLGQASFVTGPSLETTHAQSTMATTEKSIQVDTTWPLKNPGANTTAPPQAPKPMENESNGVLETKSFDYGWKETVEALRPAKEGKGWFKLDDALQIMPLSIYCNVVGITIQVEGLQEMYRDPKRKHTMMKDLPNNLLKILRRETRYKECLCDIVSYLLLTGLLTARHPIPNERFLVVLHVSAGGILLDTTSSLPAAIFVKSPDGTPFPSRKFVFSSFSDVNAYWEEMKFICLNTTLGMRGNDTRAYRRYSWNRFRDCTTPAMFEDSIVPPPGDGCGAAGFDSNLFSHLNRNWCYGCFRPAYTVSVITGKRKVASDRLDKTNSQPAAKKAATKDPRPAKAAQPNASSSPKKKPPKTKPVKTKRAAVDKQGNESGPVTKKRKNWKEHVQSKGFGFHKDVVKQFQPRTRSDFTPEQDKVMIICKIVLLLMNKVSLRNPYPYHDVKKAVEEYCEVKLQKSAPKYHDRVQILLKNGRTVEIVKTYVAEFLAEKEFQGLDDPSLPFSETFHATMKKIYERTSIRSTNLADTSKHASSLTELHSSYTLRKLDLPKYYREAISDSSPLGPPVNSLHDIRLEVARDLIQVVCNARRTHNLGMRAFSPFADILLQEAISRMQEDGMVYRKRRDFRRNQLISAMNYCLSNSYYRLFDNYKTRVTTFKECIEFEEQLKASIETGEGVTKMREDAVARPEGPAERPEGAAERQDGAVEGREGAVARPEGPAKRPEGAAKMREGTAERREGVADNECPREIELQHKSVLGGDVACILSLLITGKINVKITIPDNIVGMSSPDDDEMVFPSTSTNDSSIAPEPRAPPSTKHNLAAITQESEKRAHPLKKKAQEDKGSEQRKAQENKGSEQRAVPFEKLTQVETEDDMGKDSSAAIEPVIPSSVKPKKTVISVKGKQVGKGITVVPSEKPTQVESEDGREVDPSAEVEPIAPSFVKPKKTVKPVKGKQDGKEITEDTASSEGISEASSTSTPGIRIMADEASVTAENVIRVKPSDQEHEEDVAKDNGSNKEKAGKGEKKPCGSTRKVKGHKRTGSAQEDNNDTGSDKVHQSKGKRNAKAAKQQELGKDVDVNIVGNVDSSAEEITVGELKVFEIRHGHIHSLFTSPYDLPTTGPAVKRVVGTQKRSTHQCNASKDDSSKETISSATTLPAQRPSRISLMISRNAVTSKQKQAVPDLNKCYNSHEVAYLNDCKVVFTPLSGIRETDDASSSYVSGKASLAAQVPIKHGIKVDGDIPTLDAFLESCEKENSYNDADVELTRFIHSAAAERKELGVAVSLLKEKIQEHSKFLDTKHPMEEHLRNLYHSNLMFRVGAFEELAVCHAFIEPWCIGLFKEKEGIHEIRSDSTDKDTELTELESQSKKETTSSQFDTFPVLSRPWLNLSGVVNKEFMKSIVKCVMCTVMENPGVTQTQLFHQFTPAVRPVHLEEILKLLETRHCMSRHTVVNSESSTLFSTPKYRTDMVTYWMPAVDCLVKLNSILKDIED